MPFQKGHTINLGKHFSEEHKKNIGKAVEGELNGMYGKRHTLEARKKWSKARAGEKNVMYGKHHTKDAKRKIGDAIRGNHPSTRIRQKMRKRMKGNTLRLGIYHLEKTIKKMRKSHIGLFAGSKHPNWGIRGENCPNWKGGFSREPYPFDFNKELKELIRKRDGYQCQKCGMPECENGRKLDVHHIDYNKENLNPINLITLCRADNTKVNSNRRKWTKFFTEILRD